MAEILARVVCSPRLRLAALGALTLALGSGCVTRTVYVVDDRDEPAPMAAAAPAPQAEPPRGMDMEGPDQFYEPLAPYGTWHQHPRYGSVFSPATAYVGAGWRPYTRGHWEYTEWGWTWVSDLPFGWATSHYGRWFYDAGYGWVWAPDTRWAPAWVTWRTGGGYVGWAPMPPGAMYGGSYSVYDTSWVFVSTNNFGAAAVYPVIVTGGYYSNCLVVTRPYRSTYVVYGNSYYRGPDPDRVRNEGGRVVHRSIREVDRDRPTTRPPEGVRIGSASRSGHSGSVGSRRNGRDGDGSGRDRNRDGAGSSNPRGDGASGGGRGRDGGSGGGRGRNQSDLPMRDPADRGSDRGAAEGRGGQQRGPDLYPGQAGSGRQEDRGQGRGSRDDRGQGRGSRDDRGQGRDHDERDDRVPPRRGNDRPNRGSQAPDSVGGGLDVVPPTPYPGDGGNRGGDGGRGGDTGSDEGGVRADKDVVRPDTGEVRPPDDNPYGSHPGGQPQGFGAQSTPSPAAADRGGPADSRFGRSLPSRFGSQTPTRGRVSPSQTPGGYRSVPNPSPSAGYGAPGQSPSGGYGAPSSSPSSGYRQPQGRAPQGRGAVSPSAGHPSAGAHTAPAPAPRAAPAQPTRSQAKKQARQKQKQSDDDGDKKRSRRSRR